MVTIDRHEKHCERNFHTKVCSCGVDAGDPHWYKARLAIVEALAKGYADCKHHTAFTRRLTAYFRKYVPAEYQVSVTPAAGYSPDEVRVWGKGLRYDHCDVRIALYRRNVNVATGDGAKTWQELFERGLDAARQRFKESAEEIPREDKLIGKLAKLQEKLDAVKEEAKALVTSDGRGGFTRSASYDLTHAFPELL